MTSEKHLIWIIGSLILGIVIGSLLEIELFTLGAEAGGLL